MTIESVKMGKVKKSLRINASLNVIKQCCSIIFPLITFPYVSRVIGSDGFGKYNFSFSVADYFIIFAALGIHTYAVREGAKKRDDKQATDLFCCEVYTINVISMLISMCALIILLLCAKSLNRYTVLILIISSHMVLSTLGADWVNGIFEDYLYITVRYIFVQIIALISIFIFVHSEKDIVTYAIITTLGSAGGNLLNIFYIRKYVELRLVFNRNVITHLRPILILFANSLAISVYVNADITMLRYFRDDVEVGIYSLASRIYNIVKRMINALIIVTVPRLAYYSKRNYTAYENVIKTAMNGLIMMLLPCIVGLVLMSKPTVLLVGGEQYVDAWKPLCILSGAMFFALLSSFFTNCILVINNMEKTMLLSTTVSALVNIILNIFMLPRYGMGGAAVTTLIAEAVNLFIQGFSAKKYVPEKLLLWLDIIKAVLGTIIVFVICIITNYYFGGTLKALFIAIPLSVIAYFTFNFLSKNETLLSFVRIRRSK